MNLNIRHAGPELMDGKNIPDTDLYRNYKELHTINKMLGGYRITLKGFKQVTKDSKKITLLDIGCGGGDTMKMIAAWGRMNKIQIQLTGIDLSPAAIIYSKENCKGYPEIECIQENVLDHLNGSKKYDVVMNTLFMHHFSDEQIIALLRLMKSKARLGFVINDLERNVLAYYSIKWLTRLFSKSYLVKNDAPLSVLRSFRQEDWWNLLSNAFIANADISWEWAFRYLIIFRKNNPDVSITI